MDCIFCKIAKGEVPCDKIYEDAEVMAFLDIKPINPGHTLIIPKKHFNNLLDVDDKILSKMMSITKKLSKKLMLITKADGFNVGINNFGVAGQIVNHLHIHIIPRFNRDGYKSWERKEIIPKNKIQEISNKIKNSL